GPTGDDFLVLRGGTVFKGNQVYNHAIATVADDATETATTPVDTWVEVAGTLVQGVTTPTFTFAANAFTYIGPNQIVQTSLKAAVSLTKVLAGSQPYEVGIFVNDLLILNGMKTTVPEAEFVYVAAEVQRLLVTGDVIDMRVRSRSGTDSLTVANAQLIIG
ncbi:unnamed protein product, partial [marine sediment metagenome]